MNISRKNRSTVFLFLLTSLLYACSYNPYSQGESLYELHCGNCHASDGSGLVKLIPPITESSFVKLNPDKLSCLIRHGSPDSMKIATSYTNLNMEANTILSPAEIANIVNYVIYKFEYDSQFYSEDDVNRQLKGCDVVNKE